MTLIKVRCSCGASLKFVDESNLYIDNGRRDESGNKYIWERVLLEWQTKHSKCEECIT